MANGKRGRILNSVAPILDRLKPDRKTGVNSYRVAVGPFGPRATLYRARVNDGEYMAAGYEAGREQMEAKFIASYTRVLERAGRL